MENLETLTTGRFDDAFGRLLAGDQEMIRDPFPLVNALRETGDIYFFKNSIPVFTTHASVSRASMDDSRFLTYRGMERFDLAALTEAEVQMVREICAFEQLQLSGMNGEQHKRARRAVQIGFGASRAADIGEVAGQLVERLIDELREQGDVVDLMKLAVRVPLLLVMRMLGAREEDLDKLHHWSDEIAQVKQFIGTKLPREAVLGAHRGINSLKEYIEQMAEDIGPSSDCPHLMGVLLNASEEDRLTAEELSATFVLVFYAGHESTTNLLGNGFYELLRHRERWEELCANPSLAPALVEEVLRFNPPVHMGVRRLAEDVESFGEKISAGTEVLLLYNSANRDPAMFDRPDTFDFHRERPRHLGFGHGAHVCLGAAFARLEGKIVFDYMARRFPEMKLAEAPEGLEWNAHAVHHGLKRLPVHLGRDHGLPNKEH